MCCFKAQYDFLPGKERMSGITSNLRHEANTFKTKISTKKMNYPVRAELVANPEEYLYTPIRVYSVEKGLVEILFV
ncbi:MAG: hypothetical protein WCI54_04515 [Bacteroidia bacterium]